jgi:hypothetical protein
LFYWALRAERNTSAKERMTNGVAAISHCLSQCGDGRARGEFPFGLAAGSLCAPGHPRRCARGRWGIDGVAIAVAAVVAIYYALSVQLANRLLGVSWWLLARVHVPGLTTATVLWPALRLSKPFISRSGNAFVELGFSL